MEKYVKVKLNNKKHRIISYINDDTRYHSEVLKLKRAEMIINVKAFIELSAESMNRYLESLRDDLIKAMSIRRYPVYSIEVGFTTVVGDDYRVSSITKNRIFRKELDKDGINELKESLKGNDEFNVDYINIKLLGYETWCSNRSNEFTTINNNQTDEVLIMSCNEYLNRLGINTNSIPIIIRDNEVVKLKYEVL